MKLQFTIGVFGIIFNEKMEVLLCHRTDYDLWNLPGGRLEDGEAPWGGVIREIKEETGLDAKILKLVGIYNKSDKNEIAFSFLCEVVNGSVAVNDEADKIQYFAFNDLPKNTVPKQVERIKDVLENPDKVILKVQTSKSAIELVKEGKL